MARPRKAVPSYRLHKASGQAIVTIDGRDYYLGKFGTAASRERYARLIAEGRRGSTRDPSPGQRPTVNTVVARYWRAVLAEGRYQKQGRPTSERGLIRTVLKTLLRLYGSTPADEFGPRSLKTLRMELARGARGPRARTAVNRDVGRIVRVFRWAVSEELVPPKVVWGLQAVAGLRRGEADFVREMPKKQPVAAEDVEKVCQHLDPHLAAMVMLQSLAALRPGELTKMRTSEVDTSGDVWRYIPSSHKTENHGVERVILLGPKAQQYLSPHLRPTAPDEPIFAPALVEGLRRARRRQQAQERYGDRARPNQARDAASRRNPKRRYRESYSANAYRRALCRACLAVGVEVFSPNRLRHTALTRIRAEHGLDVAQVVAGHTSVKTTEVYAQKNISAAEDVMRRTG